MDIIILPHSAASISNMGKLVQEDVKAFHTRSVKEDYVVIYADATYIPARRDRARKEVLHVLIGIDPYGKKEVLDYALFPEESCRNYQEMIRDLKQRGLKRVLLFVSDGLTGLADALSDVFARAKHQSCWTHLIRQALSKVRAKDKEAMTEVLKKVYDRNQSVAEAQEHLEEFLETWDTKYPKLKTVFKNTQTLFTFFQNAYAHACTRIISLKI